MVPSLNFATGELTVDGARLASADFTLGSAMQHPLRWLDREPHVWDPGDRPTLRSIVYKFSGGYGQWEFEGEKLSKTSLTLALAQDTGGWEDLNHDEERRRVHDAWCHAAAGQTSGFKPMGQFKGGPLLWYAPWGSLASVTDQSMSALGSNIFIFYGKARGSEPAAWWRNRPSGEAERPFL